MIIDLQRFFVSERRHWAELESLLDRLESEADFRLNLEQARHFHYLYERTSADLAKITTFASEPETRRYLESLVARAYGEIHETRERPHRLAPVRWFFQVFPHTFRRHLGAFWLSVAITIAGSLFGGWRLASTRKPRRSSCAFRICRATPVNAWPARNRQPATG